MSLENKNTIKLEEGDKRKQEVARPEPVCLSNPDDREVKIMVIMVMMM
jgi:hypothetical protein